MYEAYYNSIPIGRENAVSRDRLCVCWKMSERRVREVIRLLRAEDNGDDYVIISLSNGSGYFRSNEVQYIRAYAEETQGRAASTLAPLRKARRILKKLSGADEKKPQTIQCHLQSVRERRDLTQTALVRAVQKQFPAFDRMMLSRAENALVILPPDILMEVSEILSAKPDEIYPDTLLTAYQSALEVC